MPEDIKNAPSDSAAADGNPTTEEIPERSGFYLWGSNEYGNLGLGHCDTQYLPVRIKDSGGEECSLVGCGGQHIVLATDSGDVFVAGRNDRGQLGVLEDDDKKSSFDRQTIPVLVDLPNTHPSTILISKVVCGYDHTLLLTQHGKLISFGNNSRGECGLGSEVAVVTKPEFLTAFASPVTDMASKGYHSLCLLADGSVWGFGANDCFQLGLGESQSVVSWPEELKILRQKSVDKIACGSYHSVVCSSLGQTWVFGDNSSGQCLTDPSRDAVAIPTPVQSLDGRRVSYVSCGFAHTIIVLADQDVVLGWGSNSHGQLGLGHAEDIRRPTRIETVCNSRGVLRAECGYNSSFFWLDGEGLYACGSNENGELGLGLDVPDQWLPTRVTGVPLSRRAPKIIASSFTVILPAKKGEDDDIMTIGTGEDDSVASSPNAKTLGHHSQQYGGRKRRMSGSGSGGGAHHGIGGRVVRNSLSDDMARLLSSRIMADVSLQAAADGGMFPVHRAVVSARCSRLGKVIAAKLQDLGATDSTPVVVLPKLTSDTLRRLLIFLYSGSVLIDDASISEILLLASCANTLAAERLFCICQEEISTLLNDENVVLVLREACELNLLSVKRICMEYIIDHFSACVSSRNRTVVEALGNNPELLAEVVGLSSPDFAEAIIAALPSQNPCPASSLEFDMESLFESGNHADVLFQAFGEEEEEEDENNEEPNCFLCHRVVLIARCPFFSNAFRALFSLKEDGDAASVSVEDRRKVSLVFESQPDSDGRIVVREINKSSPNALKAFLLYLYTDRLDFVKPDTACDVLQMSCVYGLGASRLAHECERLLRNSISPSNALDTLCVAAQLKRDDLLQFAMDYIVEHFVECVEDRDAVTECVFDFPQLGVELIRSVGARLKQRGMEDALKKRPTPPPKSTHSSPAHRPLVASVPIVPTSTIGVAAATATTSAHHHHSFPTASSSSRLTPQSAFSGTATAAAGGVASSSRLTPQSVFSGTISAAGGGASSSRLTPQPPSGSFTMPTTTTTTPSGGGSGGGASVVGTIRSTPGSGTIGGNRTFPATPRSASSNSSSVSSSMIHGRRNNN